MGADLIPFGGELMNGDERRRCSVGRSCAEGRGPLLILVSLREGKSGEGQRRGRLLRGEQLMEEWPGGAKRHGDAWWPVEAVAEASA